MFARKLLVASLLALGAASSYAAQALITDQSAEIDTAGQFDAFGISTTDLAGDYTFNIGNSQGLGYYLNFGAYSSPQVTLTNGGTFSVYNSSNSLVASVAGVLQANPNQWYSVGNFGGTVFQDGAYTLKLSGISPSALSGSIGGVATAVPEPESYAMMIAGLGAMGFMARRRKNKA